VKPKPPVRNPVSSGPPPGPTDADTAVWTDDKLPILYGATFTLQTNQPHYLTVEEGYQFVEEEQSPSEKRVIGYCVEEATAANVNICKYEQLKSNEIRLSYGYTLAQDQYTTRGYLYEEFVLTAKPVWVVLQEGGGRERWRLLNRAQQLKDASGTPDDGRMTTIVFPSHTFVSLDRANVEKSASHDVVNFPRQFFRESLDLQNFVITRVNPAVPSWLQWSVQKALSFGIANIFWQWLLLGLQGITPVALVATGVSLVRRLKKKNSPPDDSSPGTDTASPGHLIDT
jgi:hypothetical protein